MTDDQQRPVRPAADVIGAQVHATQTAQPEDVIYAAQPHYRLSEADFNRIVDPPQRAHAWANTFRGVLIGTLVAAIATILSAVAHGEAPALSLVPESVRFSLYVITVAYVILEIVIRCMRDPRREVIERIGKTWNRKKPR